MESEATSNWIEIDLSAIRDNVSALRRIAGVDVMGIVKANGYGHGIVEAGRAALQGGATWLGVARIGEALALRAAGVTAPVLVTGYAPALSVDQAARQDIRLTVYDLEQAEAYADAASKSGVVLKVHAKFDSGMGRLGVFPEQGLEFITALAHLGSLQVEGMFTHFARADEPQAETTDWQMGRFHEFVDRVERAGLRPALVHAANSAAALYYPASRYDLVRSGIAIYGLQPSDEAPLPDEFRPALSWKSRLVSIKMLPAGHGVGYAYRYSTRARERIGVAPVGYADGLRRRLGNFVLVGGQRVDLRGGVCMDQILLGLDDLPDARVGDEVVLIGRQGEQVISAEELGRAWGTVNYDVVCGLQTRVPRRYHHESDRDL